MRLTHTAQDAAISFAGSFTVTAMITGSIPTGVLAGGVAVAAAVIGTIVAPLFEKLAEYSGAPVFMNLAHQVVTLGAAFTLGNVVSGLKLEEAVSVLGAVVINQIFHALRTDRGDSQAFVI